MIFKEIILVYCDRYNTTTTATTTTTNNNNNNNLSSTQKVETTRCSETSANKHITPGNLSSIQKTEPTRCSETSANKHNTPGNNPKTRINQNFLDVHATGSHYCSTHSSLQAPFYGSLSSNCLGNFFLAFRISNVKSIRQDRVFKFLQHAISRSSLRHLFFSTT